MKLVYKVMTLVLVLSASYEASACDWTQQGNTFTTNYNSKTYVCKCIMNQSVDTAYAYIYQGPTQLPGLVPAGTACSNLSASICNQAASYNNLCATSKGTY